MTRQLGLIPGNPLPEEEIEKLVSPLHSRLYQMIQEPFDRFLELRRTIPDFRVLDEGESAQWLRPQIVDLAKQIFTGVDGVRVKRFNNQFEIIYQDSVAIVPKKLRLAGRNRTRLTFSSYETEQNENYWKQYVVAGFQDLPRVLVGYLPQKEMTEIKIMVVYPFGKFARFCYLMPDPANDLPAIYQEREDVTAEVAESRGFSINPKIAKRKPR